MTDSRYRWVIVAAGGLLGCVAIGSMFSLPVLLRPIARDTSWSVTGVSSAMTIGFLAMAFGSMAWGSLSDRLGPRAVVLTGAILLAASLALAAQATSLLAFQLVFGLLVGGSAAAIFAPMMACVTGGFDTHRNLAVSLVSAGMGMAPMTMSPLAAWLVSTADWRTALEIVAAIAALLMIPAALLVRRPPALIGASALTEVEPQIRHVCRRGAAVSAVHRAGRDQLLLLRCAFRPDLSYRELRRELRHSDDGRRLDL